jgi:glycosyltransferase involved in cell wall biosynthesis
VVTVNGRWPGQPKHVYSFLNPSLGQQDVEQGCLAGKGKELCFPIYLLFVGRIEEAKGVGRILRVAKALHTNGVPFELHLVGDGSERPIFERRAQDEGLGSCITFHGWQPKPALADFYRRAHILLFPSSSSEGWPKVLSEAMAYGVVPVASTVSSIPQILAETGAGVTLEAHDVEAFVHAVQGYVAHPERWRQASRAGMESARLFTYDAYLDAVRKMFWDAWGIDLGRQKGLAR